MGRDSNSFSIAINPSGPPSGSALATLVQSMAPGTWAQLTGVQNQNASLGKQYLGANGTGNLAFSNTAPWNALTGTIEYLGKDHGNYQMVYFRYTAGGANGNRWDIISEAPAGFVSTAHAFDHNNVNPFTGEFYHRKYSESAEPPGQPSKFRVFKTASGDGTTFTEIAFKQAADKVCVGTCWWGAPGSSQFNAGASGSLGAQGGLMMFVAFGTGNRVIYGYDPLTNTWPVSISNAAPGSIGVDSYDEKAQFSRKLNLMVYGGGHNSASNPYNVTPDNRYRLYTISASGTIIGPFPDAPWPMTSGSFLVEEPNTGGMLAIGNDSGVSPARMAFFDPTWTIGANGTPWTILPNPPAAVRAWPDGGGSMRACATSITGPELGLDDTHGCIVVTSQNDSSSGNMYVYRHGRVYITNFAGTESPISEGGKWTNGGQVGLSWTNVATGLASDGATHIAFGTKSTSNNFDDSISCQSNFQPNQSVQGTIYQGAGAQNEQEVEMLLRFQITANTARGYEITIVRDGRLYLVRWNGPIGDFNIIDGPINTGVSAANNAAWYAEIAGNVIKIKCNGVQVHQRDVAAWAAANGGATWTTGNPGIGFYRDSTLGTPGPNNSYGWRNFTAQEI